MYVYNELITSTESIEWVYRIKLEKILFNEQIL
jgi:hypothetical protein